jgi:hypothetical protein
VAKSNCTLEDGALGACSGDVTSCGIPRLQFCKRPQPLLNGTQFVATAAQNCSSRVAAGGSCSATCIPGWQGEGYNVTCLSDGNWSLPAGSGCRELPVDTTVCGACKVGNVCGDAEGCRCIKKGGTSGRCQCAANLGFKEQSGVQAGVLTSRCVWDVVFPWTVPTSSSSNVTMSNTTYYLIAPVNKTVTLQFTIGSSSSSRRSQEQPQVCPAGRVISAEQWIGQELLRCPSGVNAKPIRLALSTSKPGEACNKVLLRTYYTFDTSKRTAAKRGSCFMLRFVTTDGMRHVVPVLLA